MRYILAVDQGTTGTRAILYDEKLVQQSNSYYEHIQYYPHPGWCEHDPIEIYENTCRALNDVLKEGQNKGITQDDIACIGIANQGETVMAWSRKTALPLYKAIVWHCQRTEAIVATLSKNKDFCDYVHNTTGLKVSSYFSAVKILWLLENVPEVQEAAKTNDLCLGTIDSWLIFKMTGGKKFVTDCSTASRTMLFNIHSMDWDDKLFKYLGFNREMFAEVLDNCAVFGFSEKKLLGTQIPITASMVDQQGALFGQCCIDRGTAKVTYGTGCFLLMNTGIQPVINDSGLLATVAWRVNGVTTYALDGVIFIAGAALQWLRDKLCIVQDFKEIDTLASSISDNDDVYFVPAFSGLAAPHWDYTARGLIIGLTMGTTKAHIARAALESIAYQMKELVDIMERTTEIEINYIKADGGISKSSFLMQFQADVLNRQVHLLDDYEATSRGVAMMAGIGAGIWSGTEEMKRMEGTKETFYPAMSLEKVETMTTQWQQAVSKSMNWKKHN